MKTEMVDGWECESGYGYASACRKNYDVYYDGHDLEITEQYSNYSGASGRCYVPATVIQWLLANWEEFKL